MMTAWNVSVRTHQHITAAYSRHQAAQRRIDNILRTPLVNHVFSTRMYFKEGKVLYYF